MYISTFFNLNSYLLLLLNKIKFMNIHINYDKLRVIIPIPCLSIKDIRSASVRRLGGLVCPLTISNSVGINDCPWL